MLKNLLEQVIDIKPSLTPKTFSFINKKKECQSFVNLTKGKKPLFLLVVGSTETGLIPGLSAAGKNIEQLKLTPSLDADFLVDASLSTFGGKPTMTKEKIPISPEGIPSPVIISKAIIEMLELDINVVDVGSFIKPFNKHISLNMGQGKCISTGAALGPIKTDFLFQKGEKLASSLTDYPYIVIGECIPGGTTTALSVLCSLGVNAFDLVSSSFPEGNHFWKNQIVKDALLQYPQAFSQIKKNPLKACEFFGDPMQPFVAGFIKGAEKLNIPIMLAGGSQMIAVYYLTKLLFGREPNDTIVCTTSWIVNDKNARAKKLAEITNTPLISSLVNFKESKHNGLLAYEEGHIKEGVGAGGLLVTAELYKNSTQEEITQKIEQLYSNIYN